MSNETTHPADSIELATRPRFAVPPYELLPGRGSSVTLIASLLKAAMVAFPECLSNRDIERQLREAGVLTDRVESSSDAGAISIQFPTLDAALEFMMRCNAYIAQECARIEKLPKLARKVRRKRKA